MNYRHLPVEVMAIQFTGDNPNQAAGFMDCQHPAITCGQLLVLTSHGIVAADPGDWIVRGVDGDYYPLRPKVFEAMFESIPSPAFLRDEDGVCASGVIQA